MALVVQICIISQGSGNCSNAQKKNSEATSDSEEIEDEEPTSIGFNIENEDLVDSFSNPVMI